MIRPTGRTYALLALVLATLLAGTAFVAAVIELHDRFERHSLALEVSFWGAVIALLAAAGGLLKVTLGRRRPAQPAAPEDPALAARAQVEAAAAVIAQLEDSPTKTELERELAHLRPGGVDDLKVVLFGTSSAGKTSLASALLGRETGRTGPVLGSTLQAQEHVYSITGLGRVHLTDTPGLAEIGNPGAERERQARELAVRSDLLIFVVDHDLVRDEFDALAALARHGKRSVVFFNKTDRFTESDRQAILHKLRDRLQGVVDPDDIIAGAAAPRPILVRRVQQDGTIQTSTQTVPPDVDSLRERIRSILRAEGQALHSGNLLLRAHLLARKAQDQLAGQRDRKAEAVVDKFQWITAATVFANPFPAVELVAGGAVQLQMITELAAVYGVELSTAHVRSLGGQMVQTLLKLGLLETASSLIAGIFKSSLVGHAAGGAVQAVSLAYLTHVSGEALCAYFRHGQSWGDGGMQAELIRQFDLTSRGQFLQDFARQAIRKASQQVLGTGRKA